MRHQVTDVIDRTCTPEDRQEPIPLWLKLVWTLWVLIWAPVYFKQYGAANFLYFCDLGNLLILAALWLESRLIFSWQAVGLLIFQTLFTLDYVGALLTGKHVIGGTEYMFNPNLPLTVRLLGLYHIVTPPLLLWAVRRLGYDPRAWKWATITCWIVVPINFSWHPAENVNWARGLGHEQQVVAPWIYLLTYLLLVPAVIYAPTHFALRRWTPAERHNVSPPVGS